MRKSVLTLGTFDGVHRGHRALLEKVVSRARDLGAVPTVLAFDMPPRHAGEAKGKAVLLTTWDEKIKRLKRYGIKRVQTLVFNRRLAETTPEDFFYHTIMGRHQAQEMVVGPRLAFGRRRAGRLPLLRRLGQSKGVKIHVVSSVVRGQGAVSSRRIRALLSRGLVEKANALLGYPYSVEGNVVHGEHRGRRLGFPTANLHVHPAKILPPGVFWVKVDPGARDGVCNVGVRPTFQTGTHELRCEIFLLEGKGSYYGRTLRVEFRRRLRSERRFSSPEALMRQIRRDVAKVQLYKKSKFSV